MGSFIPYPFFHKATNRRLFSPANHVKSAPIMSPKNEIISPERIEQSIFLVRAQKVMLDSDLAELYDVPVKD
jgi:hypothetical protein